MRAPLRRCAQTSLALATLLLASACQSGPATDFCAVVQPVYISRSDVLSDDTVRQILVLNETWERLCRKE